MRVGCLVLLTSARACVVTPPKSFMLYIDSFFYLVWFSDAGGLYDAKSKECGIPPFCSSPVRSPLQPG